MLVIALVAGPHRNVTSRAVMSNTIAVGVFTVEVTAQVRAKLCTLQVTMGMSMMLYVSAASDVHLCLHLDDDPAHYVCNVLVNLTKACDQR